MGWRAPSKGKAAMQGGGCRRRQFDRKRREARPRPRQYIDRMTYRITGLDPAPFAPLFDLDDSELAARGMTRITVSNPHFPCRVSLRDRDLGETVILLNHVSHDVANAYRASHAIFVSQAERGDYGDEVPPALARRILSLRAFDAEGMMVDAALAQPGEADAAIRRLFERDDVARIHAHNAIRGCFAAYVDRLS